MIELHFYSTNLPTILTSQEGLGLENELYFCFTNLPTSLALQGGQDLEIEI